MEFLTNFWSVRSNRTKIATSKQTTKSIKNPSTNRRLSQLAGCGKDSWMANRLLATEGLSVCSDQTLPFPMVSTRLPNEIVTCKVSEGLFWLSYIVFHQTHWKTMKRRTFRRHSCSISSSPSGYQVASLLTRKNRMSLINPVSHIFLCSASMCSLSRLQTSTSVLVFGATVHATGHAPAEPAGQGKCVSMFIYNDNDGRFGALF